MQVVVFSSEVVMQIFVSAPICGRSLPELAVPRVTGDECEFEVTVICTIVLSLFGALMPYVCSFVTIWVAPSPGNLLAQNIKIVALFRTTSRLDHEYLWNATRHLVHRLSASLPLKFQISYLFTLGNHNHSPHSDAI